MKLYMGVHNPWGGPHHRPHRPQCDYLEVDRTLDKGISQTHFVGGRGSAKTTTGIIWFATVAYERMPGVPLFWSEPRDGDLSKVFLREWSKVVPQQLWEYSRKDNIRQIRCAGGTNIDLVSRKVDNMTARVGLGPNYGGGCSDEAAEKFDRRRHADMMNAVRLPDAPFRFFDTYSTPVTNGYDSWCKRDGATIIHSTSYDNPFIPSEAVDDMRAAMSPSMVASEIEGRWIRHEGRRWPNFSDKDWPAGNMHPTAQWDPDRPWYLGMDLGQGYGHWQIWQYFDPINPVTGSMEYPSDLRLAVVVAEGSQHQMTVHPVLNEIQTHYAQDRNPAIVATGMDVKTRGSTGPAPAEVIKARGWDVSWPEGELSDPRIWGQCLDRMILDTGNYRRFLISRNIKRHGPPNETWGIEHAMFNDTFPQPGETKPFLKDKRQAGISAVEDPRDSALHLCVHNHPPDWSYSTRWAA